MRSFLQDWSHLRFILEDLLIRDITITKMSKVIHQLWYSNREGQQVPHCIVRGMCTTEIWANQIGWEYHLWLNDDIDNLLMRNGMDVKKIPSSYIQDFNSVGYIADLARWCAVYEEGGLYLDSDIFVVGDGAQRDLLLREEVSMPREKINSQAYSNAAIWSPKPKDEIIRLVILKIVENFLTNNSLGNPVHECGPMFITNFLRDEGLEIGNLPWEKYMCFDWPSGCQGGQDTVLFAHVGKGLWGDEQMKKAQELNE